MFSLRVLAGCKSYRQGVFSQFCILAGNLILGLVDKVCVFSLCVLADDLISGLVGKVCVLIMCPCWQPDSGSCRQGVCSHYVSLLAT